MVTVESRLDQPSLRSSLLRAQHDSGPVLISVVMFAHSATLDALSGSLTKEPLPRMALAVKQPTWYALLHDRWSYPADMYLSSYVVISGKTHACSIYVCVSRSKLKVAGSSRCARLFAHQHMFESEFIAALFATEPHAFTAPCRQNEVSSRALLHLFYLTSYP
jgi:hypothetical protein